VPVAPTTGKAFAWSSEVFACFADKSTSGSVSLDSTSRSVDTASTGIDLDHLLSPGTRFSSNASSPWASRHTTPRSKSTSGAASTRGHVTFLDWSKEKESAAVFEELMKDAHNPSRADSPHSEASLGASSRASDFQADSPGWSEKRFSSAMPSAGASDFEDGTTSAPASMFNFSAPAQRRNLTNLRLRRLRASIESAAIQSAMLHLEESPTPPTPGSGSCSSSRWARDRTSEVARGILENALKAVEPSHPGTVFSDASSEKSDQFPSNQPGYLSTSTPGTNRSGRTQSKSSSCGSGAGSASSSLKSSRMCTTESLTPTWKAARPATPQHDWSVASLPVPKVGRKQSSTATASPLKKCPSPPHNQARRSSHPPSLAHVVPRRSSVAGNTQVDDFATRLTTQRVDDLATVLTQLRVAMDGALAAGISKFDDIIERAAAVLDFEAQKEQLRTELEQLVLKAEALNMFTADIDLLHGMKDQLCADILRAKRHQLTETEVKKAETCRRRVHNALEDRKGKIRVFCRARPLNDKELLEGDAEALTIIDDMTIQAQCGVFTFDSVFAPGTQEEVFKDCRDLVQSAVDGHNVTIFAYGQTGAGKTYTMYGSPDEAGIARRTIKELFENLGKISDRYSSSVSASMVELYNNQFLDLLTARDSTWKRPQREATLVVRQDQLGAAQVGNLIELDVSDAEALGALFERGVALRTVAANAMNSMSSRSHLIFTIKITCENIGTGEISRGKIMLCDLGGSERLKKSEVALERKKEAIEINKSLTALGDVVESIVNGHKQIPYRNHKLTQIMQDSLGGDAKTLMVVNCSPTTSSAHETSMSLKFAARAKLKGETESQPLRRRSVP